MNARGERSIVAVFQVKVEVSNRVSWEQERSTTLPFLYPHDNYIGLFSH